uniref:Spore coat protein n=1 Tax=Escherichia coli TaxID=562 RepID=A0A3G1QB20_ECOLX|nr:spore coat protein [Escherichia coli]
MGVFVEKDYRVKRKSSENGRKSAFAHKVKNGGENYKKMCGKKLTGRGQARRWL